MSSVRFSFGALALINILCCVTTCEAKTNHNCPPSSCGHIRNITFPFRLRTDPGNCGDPGYELSCEGNQTLLYLNSKEYYVQAIDYERYTIRILDPGIRKHQCPSFPINSLTDDDMPRAYVDPDRYGYYFISRNHPVIFIDCSSHVESPLYANTASCNARITSASSISSSFSYVLLGDDLGVAYLEDSCNISAVAWVSKRFPVMDITSSSSILDALANGFSLPWYGVYCGDCKARNGHCSVDDNNHVVCSFACDLTPSRLRAASFSLNCLRVYWISLREAWPSYRRILATIPVLIFSARFLFGLPCLFMLVLYKYKRQHLSNDETIEDFLQAQSNLTPIRYKYTDIRKMTKNFKEKLGEGGYGSVFKGKLKSGPFVAVKMLNKSKATAQDFINEVATIGRIHHVNVVQLIGFCVDGSKRALIYEYMPSGSLERYIFSQEERTVSLSYEKMFEISLGVARGIDYLHRGCDMQILHFDIKPHNILLDQNFTPKISDFGLAKLYPIEDSIVSLTAARGTMGYMAPELFYKNIGRVSYKADVYSYGMLLMEMAGRRKNLNPFVENLSQIYFPSWVYDQFNGGKEIGVGDISGDERKMVKTMILVALWCIQMKPADRPPMNKIVEMLEGDDERLQMPPKPFLYPKELPAADHETHANDNEQPLLLDNYIGSASLD